MKIALIGAGSVTFSLRIIRDIMGCPGLHDSTIALMDIDAQRLRMIESLARRLTTELRCNMTVEATSSRAECLDGADFVINAAAIGERELWPADREVARRNGYWSSKGFRITALRNTPLALSIAMEMESRCPDAWLLQYSNPMVANVGAVCRHTRIKAAGFCHGVQHTADFLAKHMSLGSLEVQALGINHFIFITDLRHEGRDIYPDLADWLDRDFEKVWETNEWKDRLDAPGPISRDLYRRFGLFPCNGDEHMSDYFAWYTSDEPSRQRWRAKIHYLDRYLQRGDRAWSNLVQLDRDPDGSVLGQLASSSGEVAAPVIDTIANGGHLLLHTNVPNRGCIPSLSADTVVELPTVVGPAGFEPLCTGKLPDGIAAQIRRRAAEEELQMRASIEESRDLLLQSLYLDPYTTTPAQAEQYLRDLSKVESEYVPWLV